jgi:hypothetical protein
MNAPGSLLRQCDMVAKPMMEGWPLRLAISCGVLTLLALYFVVTGFSSLRGSWVVAEVTENGRPIALDDYDRFFLRIKGSQATIGNSSWCGSCGSTIYNQGVMVREGSVIKLFKRIRMTPELEKNPCGQLTLLPDDRIAYEMGTRRLVFERSPYRRDFFSWLDWS